MYTIVRLSDGKHLGVARVAAPAFPEDKLESEVTVQVLCTLRAITDKGSKVATLKFLAKNTDVPVPEVYAWDSDASNPLGAEYMLMQKVSPIYGTVYSRSYCV